MTEKIRKNDDNERDSSKGPVCKEEFLLRELHKEPSIEAAMEKCVELIDSHDIIFGLVYHNELLYRLGKIRNDQEMIKEAKAKFEFIRLDFPILRNTRKSIDDLVFFFDFETSRMPLENYMSVTAGANKQEVHDLMNLFANAGYDRQSKHIPAIGFLASQKTVRNPDTQATNLRFPVCKEIPDLMRQTNDKILTVLHYNPDNNQTKPPQSHAEQVINALYEIYKKGLCNTVQLNNKHWYEVNQVEAIKERFSRIRIILQVSAHAMTGLHPDQIAKKVSEYHSAIDYVLIDPSRGRGIDFDVDTSAAIFHAIKSLQQKYAVVFAGGLSGERVNESIPRLIDKVGTTEFSIDAEGKLRDRKGDFGKDVLNLEKTKAYIENAHRILG